MTARWEPWHMETLEVRTTCADCGRAWPTAGLWRGLCPRCANALVRSQQKPKEPDTREGCVYRFYDADDVLLYIGATSGFFARLAAHRQQPWWKDVVQITVEHYDTRAEAFRVEALAIRDERPAYNTQRKGSRH